MLKIDGMQRKHLQNALLSAFPSWLDLKQMVDFELNENLDSIVRNSNLKHTVFELIKWAEAHGRMNDLIRAALKANPDNLELHAFAAQVHFDPNPQASFPFHDMLSHVEGQNTREIQNSSTLLSTPSMMDVGIVIALREEFTEIYKEIKNRCKPLQDAETGRYYYLFEHAGAKTNHKYKCVATFVGEMGSIKAGLLTQQLLNQWEPRTLVMLGIAASLSKDAQLGDVIIASQEDAYLENSKAIPTRSHRKFDFAFSGEVYRSSTDLLSAVRNFEFVHGDIYQDWQGHCAIELQQLLPTESLEKLITRKLVREHVQMVDGHLASGPTVGASQAFTQWLKTRDRKYLAQEMEAAGLMAAVYEYADPKRTLVLRAISDYGDERKGELDEIGDGAFRRYAMRNAIELLWRFLDAGILPPIQL